MTQLLWTSEGVNIKSGSSSKGWHLGLLISDGQQHVTKQLTIKHTPVQKKFVSVAFALVFVIFFSTDYPDWCHIVMTKRGELSEWTMRTSTLHRKIKKDAQWMTYLSHLYNCNVWVELYFMMAKGCASNGKLHFILKRCPFVQGLDGSDHLKITWYASVHKFTAGAAALCRHMLDRAWYQHINLCYGLNDPLAYDCALTAAIQEYYHFHHQINNKESNKMVNYGS